MNISPFYRNVPLLAFSQAMMMIGGVVAAIVGPNLENLTRDAVEGMPFAGSFMFIIVIYILAFIALFFLDLPSQEDTFVGDGQSRRNTVVDYHTNKHSLAYNERTKAD